MRKRLPKKHSKCIKIKPLTRRQKYEFIYLLGNLLENGFSLEQSIHFMQTISVKQQPQLNDVEKRLLTGESFAKCLTNIGFTKEQIAPIKFSEVHGDLVTTLKRMSHQMNEREKQRKEMIKVLSYPVLLLVFLFMMILGMKVFIIPQLSELSSENNQSSMFQLLDYSLKWGIGFIVIVGVVGVCYDRYLTKNSQIKKLTLYSRLPIVGSLIKSYYTALFATEWGNLLSQGMEFKDVVLVMKKKGYSSLMQEMAKEIKIKLESGIFIDEPIEDWVFLKPELTWIIRQGEIHGHLGHELRVYGQREWEVFIAECEKKIQWLQPLTFLLIAVLIISIYGSLLLPIYSGMGEFY